MASDNKLPLNLLGILLIFLVFGLLINFVIDTSWLPSTGAQNANEVLQAFKTNALWVTGVAFGCTLLWYVLGEWAIPPWAPSRTWYLAWFTMLAAIAVMAGVMATHGPLIEHTVNSTISVYYLVLGILPFWLATVCFSPTSGKYIVWPAKSLRTW